MSGSEGAASPAARDEQEVSPPGPGEAWTVLRMIRWSGQYLEERGIDGGRRDAEHLLAEALELGRLELYLQFDRPLTDTELDLYRPLLRRRARREPLQHVLGYTTFRELELAVDDRALIPRPETEVLVEAVLDWAREAGRDDLMALDVGTGGGAIALSLATEGPFERVVATDPSPAALELARRNRDEAGLDEMVELREGSFFEPIRDDERFDVVVSNPPYVAEDERESLEPEVRDWEPREALFAGEEGLEVLVPLIRRASPVLRDGGLLALEMAPQQGERLAEEVRDSGAFRKPVIRRDLAGRERILLAVRR